MISEKEITKGKLVPEEYKDNLRDLLEKVNKLRTLWNTPMYLTSGFRTLQEHIKIYNDMGIFDLALIPANSAHLSCEAIDIYDLDFSLTIFCKNHEKEMEEIGLYFEDDITKPRLHIQTRKPKNTGNRWFKP